MEGFPTVPRTWWGAGLGDLHMTNKTNKISKQTNFFNK
jgi:hypothetical protein